MYEKAVRDFASIVGQEKFDCVFIGSQEGLAPFCAAPLDQPCRWAYLYEIRLQGSCSPQGSLIDPLMVIRDPLML